MLIRLIEAQAELRFLETLEEHNLWSLNWSVLLCAFSRVPLVTRSDELLTCLKEVLGDRDAGLYVFHDGDVAVCWRGGPRKTLGDAIGALSSRYGGQLRSSDPTQVFRFFDAHRQGEELRLLLREKLRRRQEDQDKTIQAMGSVHCSAGWQPAFSPEQTQGLRQALANRASRTTPEILIVEDQLFARRLLASQFDLSFRCHVAADAEQAVQIYAEHAPDISFLDIELPDGDGHTLAALFKKHDPDGFVVMVTGNHYVKDVETAKVNRVQGFIVKPYNKQKIMDAVGVFSSRRKQG